MKEVADIEKSINSIWEWAKAYDMKQKETEKRFLILESNLNEMMKEFDTIVKQTLADKKKFEAESRNQKDKINILLKELKS
jgi:hypothetical protein